MEITHEIVIPPPYAELLIQAACDTGLSVEEIVEYAIRKYLDRRQESNA